MHSFMRLFCSYRPKSLFVLIPSLESLWSPLRLASLRGVVPDSSLDGQVLGFRFQFDLVVAAGCGVWWGIADLVLQPHVVGNLGVDEVERHFLVDREDVAASGIRNVIEYVVAAEAVKRRVARHSTVEVVGAVEDGVNDNVGSLGSGDGLLEIVPAAVILTVGQVDHG